jgi:hypothetical protein
MNKAFVFPFLLSAAFLSGGCATDYIVLKDHPKMANYTERMTTEAAMAILDAYLLEQETAFKKQINKKLRQEIWSSTDSRRHSEVTTNTMTVFQMDKARLGTKKGRDEYVDYTIALTIPFSAVLQIKRVIIRVESQQSNFLSVWYDKRKMYNKEPYHSLAPNPLGLDGPGGSFWRHFWTLRGYDIEAGNEVTAALAVLCPNLTDEEIRYLEEENTWVPPEK